VGTETGGLVGEQLRVRKLAVRPDLEVPGGEFKQGDQDKITGLIDPLGNRAMQGGAEQSALATEGGVQAASVQAGRRHNVVDARTFVSAAREQIHGAIKNHVLVEATCASHKFENSYSRTPGKVSPGLSLSLDPPRRV